MQISPGRANSSPPIISVADYAVNPSHFDSIEQEPREAGLPKFLSEWSPRDRPWDSHRSDCDEVAKIYQMEQEFQKLAGRMMMCSGRLGFAWSPEKANPDASSLKLKAASFCRVRHCPVCQWRRTLMWMARFHQALPQIVQADPTARFLFLTLTVRNTPIERLKFTLQQMNKAWDRLSKRKEFGVVRGWIRTTEVTRSQDGLAHPHFHLPLMVPSNYFTKSYIPQATWTKLWKESLRVDYDPIVDIRPLKGEIMRALRETLKYSVKPSDMKADPAWFLELTRQVHRSRFVASGGVLKDVLKVEKESNEDLLLLGSGDNETPSEFFDWSRPAQKYTHSEMEIRI